MNKTRHNITMNESVWKILHELKKIQDRSISAILEDAVIEYLKKHGYNSLYFKLISTVPECDDKENEELTKILDSLTGEDLEVVKVEKL